MKRIFIFSVITLLVLGLTGCATLFGPKTHTLSVKSTPEKAEVYINGERMGATPVVLELDPQKTYSIEYRKEGYKPITKIVKGQVGVKWIVLDILGGVIPVVVDAATGNWYEFDKEIVHSNLDKE